VKSKSAAPEVGAARSYGWFLEIFRRVLPWVIGVGYPALGVVAVVNKSNVAVYAIYVLIAATALVSERIIPWMPVPPERRLRYRGTDIVYLFTAPLLMLLLVATMPQFLAWVRTGLLGNLTLWPTSLPVPVQVAIALMAADVTYYWSHRISHHNSFLWQSHRVHHSSATIDWLMGWRVQWLNEAIQLTARYLPIMMLGVPTHVSALAIVIVTTHAMFPHENIDVHSGRLLNSLCNTPEVHRWHHVQELRFAHSNFGDVFMIWDRMFGTYNAPGVSTATALGLPVDHAARVPKGWFRQVYVPMWPERWSTSAKATTVPVVGPQHRAEAQVADYG
jgi:sterol desaturase/sphingolipid hydroxylase (fatty acid hydroxylase superfamily)